jgi:LacI family transcriptional regulator
MTAVTQECIASALGVSRSAVKAVFNPDPRIRLRPETRRRILTAAKRMGYVPHHAARRLARARAHSLATCFDQVGLIHLVSPVTSHTFVDPVCLAMMQGAEYELSKLHASLAFIRVSDSEGWDKVERMARAGGLDGWLVYGPPNDDDADRMRSTKLPFIVLGDRRCSQSVHSVNVDSFAVGQLAVRHLASLGHRRIGFLGSDLRHVYERETFAGFHAAIRELGLDEDERLVANLSGWTEGPASLVEWLRDCSPMPTAVFASEFDWAPWVHGMLRDARIEVPRQISVLGYETASPATERENFTRIELPMTEVGREGALLLHRVASGARVQSREVRISPSLIEGWSTAAPSSNSDTTNQGKIV